MKKFFVKIKDWFIRHKPSKRRLIQIYTALLYNANLKGYATGKIYTGGTKVMCVPGFNCYSCPGAVGACPLGSLQNALAASKTRAPFYVFGIIILFGLLLGRTICGFLCPMGLIQDLIHKIKSHKLKKSRITQILSYFKYVLLVAMVIIIPLSYSKFSSMLPAFCKYICPVGTVQGSLGLLFNPNNDSFFEMLGPLFTWKFSVMVVVLVASIFIYRPFCRFLCPLGAIYGFFCRIAMLGIKLDKQKCIDCGLCIQTCKVDINRVGDHECINCGECIKVCPTNAISWKGGKFFLHDNAMGVKEVSSEAPTVELADVIQAKKAVVVNACGTERQTNAENAKIKAIQREDEQEVVVEKNAPQKAKTKSKKAFWLEFTAWAIALAVLVTALVYYNFIHEEPEADSVYQVGDVYDDFEVRKFFEGNGQTYKLSDDLAEGKVVILNFWFMECKPCEAEIPHFGALATNAEYKDKISVVFVHSNDEAFGAEDIVTYNDRQMTRLEKYIMNNKFIGEGHNNWQTFYESVTWVMDISGENSLFLKSGGKSAYPITVILDKNGEMKYVNYSSINADTLQTQVDDVLSAL